MKISKERIDQALKSGPSEVAIEMKAYNQKLREIEEKSKCLRVQFLDWLSDKLLDWSNRVHEVSVKIDTPCVIKVEPRKKEQSKHASQSKEIDRLNRLLKELREEKEKK